MRKQDGNHNLEIFSEGKKKKQSSQSNSGSLEVFYGKPGGQIL